MIKSRLKLTKTAVAAISPPASGVAFTWDAELPGFGVRTTAKGVKTYILQRRIDGKEHRISIGRTNEIGVEEARRIARGHVGDIAKGKNPVVEKAARKEKAHNDRIVSEHTLARLLELYCDFLDRNNKASAKAVRRDLTRNIVVAHKRLASKAARDVTKTDIAGVLRDLSEAGKKRASGKVRAYLRAAYQLAINADSDPDAPRALIPFRLTSNPVIGIKPSPIGLRDRVLSEHELRAFLVRLEREQGAPADLVRGSLYLAGQRPTQLARVTLDDLDLVAGTLVLKDAKGRRTQPREHHLPVLGLAMGLLSSLSQRSKSLNSPHLFTASGTHRVGVEQASQVVARISRDMLVTTESSAQFQLSDVRRTAETMLAALRIDKDTRAQLLSHGLGGVQSQRYDRHSYKDEKREAMTKWNTFLEGTVESH